MKKVICLITNWYPTKDNPFQGVFFREQALALKDYFNFLIVHYDFKRFISNVDYQVSFCKNDHNITEYQIHISPPSLMNSIKGKLTHDIYKAESDFSRKLLKAFKENNTISFDILYCVDCQLEAGYLKTIADAYNKPYVISEHAPVPWPGTIITPRNKEGIERANLLLAISYDKLRQIMMQDIKLPPYIYIGNMVDDNQFTYKPSHNKIKTFIMVGAHVFYKNYELLIRIMNKLTHLTSIPFRLMIVGYNANKGYSRDVDVLEKAIKESDFSQFVEMIPSVEHNKMNEVFNRADAFIMTSVQEGMPVSAIEAGCCGLPIFSTRCGGVEDYVTDQIGRIYNVLDADSFAQGLCDFLEGKIYFDPKHIRNTIVSSFGKDAFVKTMVSAFNSLIGE